MKDTLKKFIILITGLLENRSGKTDFSDRVISLIVAALILFSLFGTMYSSYVSGNTTIATACPPYYNVTSPCPTSHTALFGIIVTLLIVGFVIMIWKAAKGSR